MSSAPPNPLDEQISDLRKLFDHLDQRYMTLVATFSMLRPTMIHKPLVKRLFKQGKQPGASLIATALFEICILNAWTLIFDDEPTNPSLGQMMRPFHRKRRQSNAELLKRLEARYSERPIYWPESPEPWPPQLIQGWKDRHKQETELRRQEFWNVLDALALDWGLLCRTFEPLRDVRKKFVAHYELERDPEDGSFRQAEISPLPELYSALKQSVNIIAQIVANLATILVNTDIGSPEFRRLSRRNAAIFWELIPLRP
jgi:hypothetical protein